ncbi:PAS domain S-box protein [Roseomonas sp. F4]
MDSVLLLDAMAEVLPDCAAIRLAPDGQITHWSTAAVRVLGHAPASALGQPLQLLYPPDDVVTGRPAQDLEQAAAQGSLVVEALRCRADGSCFRARSIFLQRATPAAGFVLLVQDLTESDRAEQALRTAHDELERRVAELAALRRQRRGAGEARFRQVVEAAPNAMVMINAAGLIEMVNAQAERVFGYARDEMLGQPIEMLVPARYRGHHPGLRGVFFAAPRSRPMGAGRDLYGLRKDGREFPVEIGLNPIETEEGPMVLSAILDLSARVQLEAQLRQAQKMEAVGRLTAGVAHDFNNLLQAMLGSLEMLRDRVQDDAESDDLVSASIETAMRGARLTHHLLAFSRKQVLRPSRIGIAELLHRTVAMLERTLGPNIRIQATEEAVGLHAFADPAQLEACILNLAINARDAMPRGGHLTIRALGRRISAAEATETLPAGDYVVLEVQDTGTGIEVEILEQIFEPFFTTKNVGEGSGLGLPMVLGYARQSGGDVRVLSTPGHGTRVELFLPRSTRADPPKSSSRAGFPSPPAEGRVLLVDDVPAVLHTLGAFLAGAGYEVVRAGSGEEALRTVIAGRPLDCVVTDYAMPGLSGLELLRRVQELRPGLPVLMVTGYPGVESLRDLPPHIQILRKPFLRAELLERVRGLVRELRNAAE